VKREYSNDNLTIFWDSSKCIRSGNCDRQLPEVFDINKRPWVNINAADAEEIKRVIDTCPTGALSYSVPGALKSETATIKIQPDGPYKVEGNCELIGIDGGVIEAGEVFALCRCGQSSKMPFCDGSHYRSGFKDS
jgi:uncharacterized Fe-S cluster protein YjdI